MFREYARQMIEQRIATRRCVTCNCQLECREDIEQRYCRSCWSHRSGGRCVALAWLEHMELYLDTGQLDEVSFPVVEPESPWQDWRHRAFTKGVNSGCWKEW